MNDYIVTIVWWSFYNWNYVWMEYGNFVMVSGLKENIFDFSSWVRFLELKQCDIVFKSGRKNKQFGSG